MIANPAMSAGVWSHAWMNRSSVSCRDRPGTDVCTTLLQYYRSSLSSINSPDFRGQGVCLWSVLNCGPTCVCKRNMMRVPFGERRARPTDRLGCDANATGVLYTPYYMCTAVFLRLFSMAQSMDTKLYYLKVEGGAF